MSALEAIPDPFLAQAIDLRHAFAEHAVENDRKGGRPDEQLRHLKESGLLTIGIPREYGGAGANWSTILRIVREFAKADGSIAHLFGYHFNFISLLQVRASPPQREQWLTTSARNNWIWGNSVNSFSKSLFGRKEGSWWILNGQRPFSSGSHVADALTIAWEDEVTNERLYAIVNPPREGLTVLNDWDGFGQTQTGSGTVTYKNVRIHERELLENKSHEGKPFAFLGPLQQQSVLLNVFIGSAIGALEDARDYTLTKSRPWVYSGVERHIDDPWVKRIYGEFYIRLKAAELLADAGLKALSDASARGPELTAEERGEAAIKIAAANAHASEIALEVTSKIHEVMGARSVSTQNGFDRFWRNVRVHSLHNPAEYKTRNVGHWYLTGEFPEPGTFQ